MDRTIQHQLIELDNAFYRSQAASFSATRSRPWEGWRQIARLAQTELVTRALIEGRALRVLDVGCGNLRFERYLREALPHDDLAFTALDCCDGLIGTVPDGVEFVHRDVLASLMDAMEGDGAPPWAPGRDGAPLADLTVCFGFMHHVPGASLRAALLEALLRSTRPGGIVACSYWRFMDDERLARKVAETEGRLGGAPSLRALDRAELEDGDHFLGWQDDGGAVRYCHHVDEPELDGLVHHLATPVEELMRFDADGGSGRLNRYSVLRRLQ